MPIDTSDKAKRQHEKNHLRHVQRMQNIAPHFIANSFKIKPLTLFQNLLLIQFIGFALAEPWRPSIKKDEKVLHSTPPHRNHSAMYQNSSALSHGGDICDLGDFYHTAGSTLGFFSTQQQTVSALSSELLNKNTAKEKKVDAESVAREVCNKIYNNRFHLLNNPPGTTIEAVPNSPLWSNPLSFSYPQNYSVQLARKQIDLLRSYIDNAQQKISANYNKRFQKLLEQFHLSEEMMLLSQDYFKELMDLHYLRLSSAYFESFGGGNCGEMSAHVAYTMLIAYYNDLDPKEIPSIRQVLFTDEKRPPSTDHAICMITLRHARKTFLCDPWFHQGTPFITWENRDSHLLLRVHNYKGETLREIGTTRDISSLPQKLQDDLQNFRKMLIEEPYKVPEEERMALRAVAQEEPRHPRPR